MKEIFFLCLCDREGMEIAVTNVITLTMYKIGVGNERGHKTGAIVLTEEEKKCWGKEFCINFDMMVYAVYVFIFHSKNLLLLSLHLLSGE